MITTLPLPQLYAGEFDDILDRSSKLVSEPAEEIQLVYHSVSSHVLESNGSMPKDKHKRLLDIENLTVQTPSKATLVRDLKLVVDEMDHLLVSEVFLNLFVDFYYGKHVGAEKYLLVSNLTNR